MFNGFWVFLVHIELWCKKLLTPNACSCTLNVKVNVE